MYEKKRGVAYVRVSTASTAQLHSYEFQEQYWQNRFADDPEVELITIYADRGISGSSVYKRPQFLIMMQDAREGKFDVIYTKSVSRFARNTVQLLEAVRELRDLGIGVVFEKEQINTLTSTSELFLTLAATIAENDLQVDSERQKWSIQHRYENGWINIGSGIEGYSMTKDNNLVIVPEEAAVIRRIYDMYTGGKGCTTIANVLNAEGKRNRLGNPWRPNGILDIIDNEKYMGDALMGKWKIINGVQYHNSDGQYGKRYYVEDSHEGIVSKETFHRAQEIRKAQRNELLVGKEHTVYPFTGKIECGQCGTHYRHKIGNSGKKWQCPIWACGTALRHGVAACDCTRIKNSVLEEKFVEAYNQFVRERPDGYNITAMQSVIDELYQEEKELAGLMMKHLILESIFRTEQQRIKQKIAALYEEIREQKGKSVLTSDYETIAEFSPDKVEKFISRVIVNKGVITFVFYNGVKISKEYSNGRAGNQRGWREKQQEDNAWQVQ